MNKIDKQSLIDMRNNKHMLDCKNRLQNVCDRKPLHGTMILAGARIGGRRFPKLTKSKRLDMAFNTAIEMIKAQDELRELTGGYSA